MEGEAGMDSSPTFLGRIPPIHMTDALLASGMDP